ncbi:MAG: pyridoxal-phosphate dependent enzyme [Gammaproteobacteria bacterium]|nr:pyridoxal-phosphate dependent enzyme [Gammaproteobacteria bacterium]MCW9005944.1 pyridoxal-phosphate dependent enzyme [Gammaproteobacteria bacterium]MCW9056379.1 pyridoxal-phosphate dependent enzyme [Gammaproteobacteria bacterium]
MYETLNLQLPSPVTQIHDSLLEQKKIKLFIKRDDQIHPHIQGNKWRKLKYNLIAARSKKFDTLLTFGGAFSNHIHATAAAGHYLNFKTIGIIRGEETLPLNPTLQDAINWGMELNYISRSQYREKSSAEFIEQLKHKHGNFFLIPEGGSSSYALKGCEEIIKELDEDYDYVCAACGTGATLAGIISGLNNKSKTLGFPILKAGTYIEQEVNNFLKKNNRTNLNNWKIEKNYHFGGYAKTTGELISFIIDFHEKHNIRLDPVYTAKMFYGLFDLIEKDYFKPETRIIAIHTGGLQGLRGFNLKLKQ